MKKFKVTIKAKTAGACFEMESETVLTLLDTIKSIVEKFESQQIQEIVISEITN